MKISLNLFHVGAESSDVKSLQNKIAQENSKLRSQKILASTKTMDDSWQTSDTSTDSSSVTYKKDLFIASEKKCKEKKSGKILVNIAKGQEIIAAYINGKEVLETKRNPNYLKIWNIPHEFEFDQEILEWDGLNEFSIKIRDPFDGGGIY